MNKRRVRIYNLGGDLQQQAGLNPQAPTGQDVEYNEFEGNSHEEGGIALGQDAEVEGGEVRVKDYIFSDFLTDPATGKTFAELAKKVEKKYEGRGDFDAPTNRAKEKELAAIMEKNEVERLHQEELEAAQQESAEAAEQVMSNDIEQGLTEEGLAPEEGMQEMPQEGMPPQDMGMPQEGMEDMPVDEGMLPEFRYGGNVKKYFGGGPFVDAAMQNANLAQTIMDNPVSQQYSDLQGKSLDKTSFGDQAKSFLGDSHNQGLLASLAPAVSDLARSSRVEDTRFARIPDLPTYDGSQARMDVDRQAGRALTTAQQGLRNLAPGTGGQLAASAQAASSIADAGMRNMAGITDREQQSFVDAKGRQVLGNVELENQERIARAQDRAMRESMRSMSEKDISMAIQGKTRDDSMRAENEQFNQMQTDLINQLYPNYKFATPEEQADIEKKVKWIIEYSSPTGTRK